MIWVILEKKNHHSIYNLKIIEWIRNNLQKNNLDYKLLFVNDYMFDNEFSQITNKDYVFWNPNIASKNNMQKMQKTDVASQSSKTIAVIQTIDYAFS